MSLITWKDEFSVGVDAVDAEHRELIDLINDLDAAMQGQVTHATVMRTLGEIYARISAHFALEEKIMRDADYEELAIHKQEHEALLDVLLDVLDDVEEDGRYDRAALSTKLDHWFTDHFRTHDAKLHEKLG